MSACVGAASAGARVMTGTSSQGLALMYEILPIASSLRLPIVMCEVNRAISGPINIHCDHSDTIAARDFGWIQIYTENAQEAYDSVIQAVKIAEKARLPIMVTTDGFIISHCMERMEMLEDKEAQDFIGEYTLKRNLLDVADPTTRGSLDLQDYFFEHRFQVERGMVESFAHIKEVAKEFGDKFGRHYSFVEEYKTEDADRVIVAIGSTCGTARVVVDELREKGEKVGLLRLRVFRPFPKYDILKALANVKNVAVLDRSDSYSANGSPVYTEIKAALFDEPVKPKIVNYVYGLGGRDITIEHIKSVFEDLKNIDSLKEKNYLGIRE